MLSEILGDAGWNTYAVGKWHLCPDAEMNLAASRRNWPVGRGFERFYGFLGAETNQWYPDLVHDNHPVEQPASPEEGYHFTADITDKALAFIKDANAVAPEKPFFLYYAPGAAHAPHHAPKEWIDRYRGRFDLGYEAMREQILARQKDLGLVPADTELPPVNPVGTPQTRTGPDGKPFPIMDFTKPWASLGDDEKHLFARMAEVYAGFLAHADHHIGRLLDYLDDSGLRENTMVIVVSDNGASGEGGPDGSVNEMKFLDGIPDDLSENLSKLDELGGPDTYNHYPNGWAMAFNTPFKDVEAVRVQRRHQRPVHHLLAHGPESARRDPHPVPPRDRPRPDDSGRVEHQNRQQPSKGYTQSRFDGVSMRYSFDDASATGTRTTQFYSMLGSRAIWHEGWKAVTNHPAISGWGHFEDDEWELYHTDIDRSEIHNLIPETAEVPESQSVNIRNRSYAIGALVDIPEAGAEGVIFAHGAQFGGHALYVKDNRLHYAYSFIVGSVEQTVVADRDLPVGENMLLSAAFDKQHEDPPGLAVGALSLYHGETKVGETPIKTQPGKFALGGEGLCVGRDSGAGVTNDYPGRDAVAIHRRHHPPRRRRRQRRALRRPRTRGPGHADARIAHRRRRAVAYKKTVVQSFFMLTTVQPSAPACSSACSAPAV